MLISILSIEKIFASAISFLVARGAYKKWQEEKIVSFEYFFKGMFWLGVFCMIFCVMPLFAFNLYLVQILWILIDFFALISFAYLCTLSLFFLGLERFYLTIKKVLLWASPVTLIIESIFLRPVTVQIYSIFAPNITGISWLSSFPFKIWFGVVTFLFGVLIVPLITIKALNISDSLARKKGIFVALGYLGLSLACVWMWILRTTLDISPWLEVSQGVFCISGQIFFALGMLQKRN